MPCYRSGGCGPYEHLSCSECPASKKEYLVPKSEPKVGKNTGIQEMFPMEYVQGYHAALADVRRVLLGDGMVQDMKFHKRRITLSALREMVDVLIDERAILRENPNAFVRCKSEGGFEVYIAHKDENGKYV